MHGSGASGSGGPAAAMEPGMFNSGLVRSKIAKVESAIAGNVVSAEGVVGLFHQFAGITGTLATGIEYACTETINRVQDVVARAAVLEKQMESTTDQIAKKIVEVDSKGMDLEASAVAKFKEVDARGQDLEARATAKFQEVDVRIVSMNQEYNDLTRKLDSKHGEYQQQLGTVGKLSDSIVQVEGRVALVETTLHNTNVISRMTIVENVSAAVSDRIAMLERQVAALVASGASGGAGGGWTSGSRRKGVLEFKCVSDLERVGSDRLKFRGWHDKFVNALTQVDREYRELFLRLSEDADKDKEVDVKDPSKVRQWLAENMPNSTLDAGQVDEDVYAVLKAKAEGEADERMMAVPPGSGLVGYVRLYKWFTGTTGTGLKEMAKQVMSPTPPKEEVRIADAIDRWVRQDTLLSKHPGFDLGYRMKIAALKELMVGKAKEQFEMWEGEHRTVDEEVWQKLLGKAREYATRRRLEALQKKGGDSMDIGEVGGGNDDDGSCGWSGSGWDNSWDNYDAHGCQVDVCALGKGKWGGKGGKGKGKSGKGFQGSCYNCGEHGHSQRFCTKPPTGKAKGKGKTCHNCGEEGHFIANCPHPKASKGEGKGKGSWKGKGKGIWEVGQWGWEQEQGQQWSQQQQQTAAAAPPWVEQQSVPSAGGGMNLGGALEGSMGTCGMIERGGAEDPWRVVMSKARGRNDMRPARIGGGTTRTSDARHQGFLGSLDREGQSKSIDGVERFRGEWEKIVVTADSGAIDSVTPKDSAEAFRLKETEASRKGMRYRAANGSGIKNYGEKDVSGYNGHGGQVSMTLQVADVTKTLGSVYRWVEAGNRVVFDRGSDGKCNSYILNKGTGAVTKMYDSNGAFCFDLWVKRDASSMREDRGKLNSGRYHVLGMEEEEEQQGFLGLDDFM